jgi:hypothetical protein
MIEIIQPGSPVLIGGHRNHREKSESIPATVIAVMIEENRHVTYKCIWWQGRDRKELWLESIEVERMPETQQQKIGFSQ